MDSLKRVKTLQISVVAVAIVLLLRLFYIQVIDDSYKSNAANNVLRYTVQYPPRGEVYDRNGRFLVQSKEAYDLMAIPREIRPFDTAAMSRILGVSVEQIRKELRKASNFSRRRASVIFKQLPKEVKLRFEEHGGERGIEDIDPIDLLGRYHFDGPGHGFPLDRLSKQIAVFFAHLFRVVQQRVVPSLGQDDGRRRDGTGQRSATGFVAPGFDSAGLKTSS